MSGQMGLRSNAVPTLFGENLPKMVSADPEAEPEPENGHDIFEMRSPLANRKFLIFLVNGVFTPVYGFPSSCIFFNCIYS